MSDENYCTAAVTSVKSVSENCCLRLPPKRVTPLSCGYHPEVYETGEINADGFEWYKKLIGTLRWAVEIDGSKLGEIIISVVQFHLVHFSVQVPTPKKHKHTR